MYKTILLPIDLGDKHSWRKALPTAVSLCESYDARLVVMTVVPDMGLSVIGPLVPPEYEQKIQAKFAQHLRQFVGVQIPPGIEVQRVVVKGKIYQQIINQAAQIRADLIVMGSHRPELKDYLLGPNAARVVRHAGCSVMIVRD